jgi:hypothetical protein
MKSRFKILNLFSSDGTGREIRFKFLNRFRFFIKKQRTQEVFLKSFSERPADMVWAGGMPNFRAAYIYPAARKGMIMRQSQGESRIAAPQAAPISRRESPVMRTICGERSCHFPILRRRRIPKRITLVQEARLAARAKPK